MTLGEDRRLNKLIGGFLFGNWLFLYSPLLVPTKIVLILCFFILMIGLAVSRFVSIKNTQSLSHFCYKWLAHVKVAILGFVVGILWCNTYSNYYFEPSFVLSKAQSKQRVLIEGIVAKPIILSMHSGSEEFDQSTPIDVISSDLIHSRPTKAYRFNLALRRVDGVNVSLRTIPLIIEVYWHRPTISLKAGQTIKAYVKLKAVSGVENTYGFDYAKFMLSRDIRLTGKIDASSAILIMGDSSIRQDIIDGIATRYQDESLNLIHDDLLFALTTGEKSLVSNNKKALIKKTGVGHLFAISGLHIGVIFLWFLVMFRWVARVSKVMLSNKSRSYISDNVTFPVWAALACVGFYVYLIGFPASAVRALGLIMLFYLSKQLYIKTSILQCLLIVAGLTIAYDPYLILNISWQLSFFAVLGIGVFLKVVPVLNVGLALTSPVQKCFRVIILAVLFQIFITLWMLPIVIWHFQYFNPLSIINNLVVTPVVTIMIIPLIVISLFSHVVSQVLSNESIHHLSAKENVLSQLPQSSSFAQLLSTVSQKSLSVADTCVDMCWVFLANVNRYIDPYINDGAVTQHSALPIVILGMFLPLATIFLNINVKMLTRRCCRRPIVVCFALISVAGLGLMAVWSPTSDRLVVFDVGQGSAALVAAGSETILIDLGPVYYSGANATERVIKPSLIGYGLDRIDRIIITHFDADHRGNIASLLGFDVLSQRNCAPYSGRAVTISILWPPKNHYSDDRNDSSCVFKVTLVKSNVTVLFSGDISSSIEYKLAVLHRKGLINLTSDVMISPHHGSAYSSSLPYINAIQPDLVIHDAGYQNRFGFPRPETIKRYARYDVRQIQSNHTGEVTIKFAQRKDAKSTSTVHGVNMNKLSKADIYFYLNHWIPFWKKQNPFSFQQQIR